jgi:hypothetical protein
MPPTRRPAADRRPAAAAVRAGRRGLLAAPMLAIVGSRRPTPQGLDNARAFARQLGERRATWSSPAWRSASTAPRTKARWPAPAGTVAVVGTGPTASTRPATARWPTASRAQGCAGQRIRCPARRRCPQLPAAQPHHRRPVAGHPGGRSGAAVGLADHGAAGRRGRARGVRHPGLDPRAAVARLPRADQAGRQAGGNRRRHPGRTALAGPAQARGACPDASRPGPTRCCRPWATTRSRWTR